MVIGTLATFGISRVIDSQSLKDQIIFGLVTAEEEIERTARDYGRKVDQIKKENRADPIGFIQRLFGIPSTAIPSHL